MVRTWNDDRKGDGGRDPQSAGTPTSEAPGDRTRSGHALPVTADAPRLPAVSASHRQTVLQSEVLDAGLCPQLGLRSLVLWTVSNLKTQRRESETSAKRRDAHRAQGGPVSPGAQRLRAECPRRPRSDSGPRRGVFFQTADS